MSSHNLKVESGRHNIPKIPIEQRICDKCNANDIEDEIHCLLMSDRNSIPRLEFLSKVSSFIPDFENLDKIQRFTSLMSDKRPIIIQALNWYLFKSQFF